MNQEDQAQQLYIPEKLRVGFQQREGTYTGMLAYVIYYDKEGVLRKEKSWHSWRNKEIESQAIDNTPTEGFVLNKKVGGYKGHWNFRDAHVRVYDPRGFEFEISVPNLLFILREGDCSRGKGLEGKFVYAWDKTELVLLPCHSEDYKQSQKFTDLQGKRIAAKELKEGWTYLTKDQKELTYLGKFDYHFAVPYKRNHYYNNAHYRKYPGSYDTTNEFIPVAKKEAKGVRKKFVFWNGEELVCKDGVKNIAAVKNDSLHPDYAELVDKYNKSIHGSKVVRLFLKEVAEGKKDKDARYCGEPWFYEDEDGSFIECTTQYQYENGQYTEDVESIRSTYKYYLVPETGLFIVKDHRYFAVPPGTRRGGIGYSDNDMPYRQPTEHRLFAETENGSKIRIDNYSSPFYKR